MTTKMKKTQRPPILPRDAADPVGVGALERAAVKDFKSRLRRIGKHYKALLDRIPRELQINSVYQFQAILLLLQIHYLLLGPHLRPLKLKIIN